MVLMVFAEHQWRHRHWKQTYGYSYEGKERVGGMETVTCKHTLQYVK